MIIYPLVLSAKHFDPCRSVLNRIIGTAIAKLGVDVCISDVQCKEGGAMRVRGLYLLAAIVLCFVGWQSVLSQDEKKTTDASTLILWEDVDVSSRDLFRGPTSEGIVPVLEKVTFLGRQPGGNNLKYRIKDGSGREWVVKIADESQAEVAAVRFLWAVGYRTEIDQIVPRINIEKIGSYKNARFEARPETIKRGERWSWTNNPHIGTKEFDGLKIMMALVNNWDLKDDNNIIITDGGKSYMVVSDLGSSFGKLAKRNDSRSGRSVNDPEGFANAGFIKAVNNGVVEFDYRGGGAHLMSGIKVENARWLVERLLKLSDKQISDAFRAANYSDEDIALYTSAVKARIAALDKAAQSTVAAN